jgi:hypothetical protein
VATQVNRISSQVRVAGSQAVPVNGIRRTIITAFVPLVPILLMCRWLWGA